MIPPSLFVVVPFFVVAFGFSELTLA